LHVDGVS